MGSNPTPPPLLIPPLRQCGVANSCGAVARSKDAQPLVVASYEPLDAHIEAADFRRSAAYLVVLIRNPVDSYHAQLKARSRTASAHLRICSTAYLRVCVSAYLVDSYHAQLKRACRTGSPVP